MLLSRQLAGAVQNAGNTTAIFYLGKEIRFSELALKVAKLSYLYQNELGQRARVAFLASNCPAVIVTFFALSNTRATVIPLDPSCGFEELGKWLRDTEATHLAVSSDKLGCARELLRAERLNLPLIEIEKKMGGEYDASFTPPPDSPPKDTDPVLLLRTAGISEAHRYAVFDHNRLQSAVSSIRGIHRAAPAERFLSALNWSHPFAFVHSLLFPILNGNGCVIDPGMQKKEYLKFLRDMKVSRWILWPEIARELLAYFKEIGSKPGLLKSMVVGIGGVSDELQSLADEVGVVLQRCYGQTENLWTIALDELSEAAKKPRPRSKALVGVRYKVIDANGDAIEEKGERTGLLAVSGGTVMVGYRGPASEKKEAETLTKMRIRGTWLYTGDVATLCDDEDGGVRVQVLGRREQLLEEGGRYLSPEEMDVAVLRIPGCKDGAGFVTTDMAKKPILACAFVKEENRVLRPPDVLFQLKGRLTNGAIPIAVAQTDSIPRTAAGVNRCRLGRLFSGISPTEVIRELPPDAGSLIPVENPEAPAEGTAPTGAGGSPAATESTPDAKAAPEPAPVKPTPVKPAEPVIASATPSVSSVPPSEIVTSKPAVQPAPPKAAPESKTNSAAAFVAFEISKIVANEPLPASIYLYLEFRFVEYVPKGACVSRAAYDRLQFKKIGHVFVKQSELARMNAWAAEVGKRSGPPATSTAADGTEKFRNRIREHTLAIYQGAGAEKRLEQSLDISRQLIDEVARSPYAIRPLEKLQTLSNGTVDHSINVSMLSVYLALQMGYSHQLILQHLGAGALLHDFGKSLVAIESGDSLETVERKMREHPALGVKALEAEGKAPKELLLIIGQHHEYCDGSGYPQGLRGSQIYDLAKIVTLANSFDDLVTQGEGELKSRQGFALRQLGNGLRPRFDAQKLAKALRILGGGLGAAV